MTAKIDTTEDALHFFTQWLYREVTLQTWGPIQTGMSHEQLQECLELHALGKKMGCFDFMDFILDGIIDNLPNAKSTVCDRFVMEIFANEFESKEGGWNLAIDLLLYMDWPACEFAEYSRDCDYVSEVPEVDDRAQIVQLARRISTAKGYLVAEAMENPDFNDLLVRGFLDHKKENGPVEIERYPWTQSRCQYHRHKEMGLPCYSENGAERSAPPAGNRMEAIRERLGGYGH